MCVCVCEREGEKICLHFLMVTDSVSQYSHLRERKGERGREKEREREGRVEERERERERVREGERVRERVSG